MPCMLSSLVCTGIEAYVSVGIKAKQAIVFAYWQGLMKHSRELCKSASPACTGIEAYVSVGMEAKQPIVSVYWQKLHVALLKALQVIFACMHRHGSK
eukprot:scaffold289046_cov22-Tisochrysis_lutea.AAC.2